MKKISFSAALFLSALLLCSCAQGSSKNSASDAAPVISEQDIVTGVSYEPFKIIQPCERGLSGSGNSQGFYEVLDNPDRSKNVFFTDYATKQQVYLCAQPNCDHANSSCPSWIPAPESEMYMDAAIIATEQELLWTFSSPDIPARIEKSALNGTARTLVYEFPSNIELSPGLAWNGAQLAVMGTSYAEQENEDVSVQSALYIIDVASGTCTPIQALSPSEKAVYEPGAETLHFLGVTENGFAVKKITRGEFEFDQETGESVEKTPTHHVIYEIPFDGSDAKILLEHNQDECWDNVWGGDLYYLGNRGEGNYSLSRVDGATGETTVIVDDFAAYEGGRVIADNDFRCIEMITAYDEYVIIEATASERYTERGDIEIILQDFAVNTQDGSITPLTLSNYYHATGTPIQILADAGESLYVIAEVKELSADGTGSMMGLARRRAMISKEDYLNSVPNYSYVDMIRED